MGLALNLTMRYALSTGAARVFAEHGVARYWEEGCDLFQEGDQPGGGMGLCVCVAGRVGLWSKGRRVCELGGGMTWGDFGCVFDQCHLTSGRAGQQGVLAACIPRDLGAKLIGEGIGILGRLCAKVRFLAKVGVFSGLAPHDLMSVSHFAKSARVVPQQVNPRTA